MWVKSMKLDAIELRTLKFYLSKALENEKQALKKLDEDSDEYMELANDLMVLDVLVSKTSDEKPNE